MTLRITFGIDPGISGAVATLLDGEPGPIIDMPSYQVRDQSEVDALSLYRFISGLRVEHPGAYICACIERVRAMPSREKDGSMRKQGGQSMFVFGDNYGKPKAVLEVMRVPYVRAEPASWKRHFHLLGQPKDAARELALKRFPSAVAHLKRKKDCGRADALLLALWLESTAGQP